MYIVDKTLNNISEFNCQAWATHQTIRAARIAGFLNKTIQHNRKIDMETRSRINKIYNEVQCRKTIRNEW